MSTGKILVVEDERLIARDIAMQLSDLGYATVGLAHTAEQALELARQLRPDLVLMDVHLGGAMDGIAVAQIIRTELGVPSVYLSAFSDNHSLERAKLTEPAGYLKKPFMEYELSDVLAQAFKGR